MFIFWPLNSENIVLGLPFSGFMKQQIFKTTMTKASNLLKCLESCDLKNLIKPKNADQWICDKSITNDKVQTLTKCKIACKDGFDFHKGKATFIVKMDN